MPQHSFSTTYREKRRKFCTYDAAFLSLSIYAATLCLLGVEVSWYTLSMNAGGTLIAAGGKTWLQEDSKVEINPVLKQWYALGSIIHFLSLPSRNESSKSVMLCAKIVVNHSQDGSIDVS